VPVTCLSLRAAPASVRICHFFCSSLSSHLSSPFLSTDIQFHLSRVLLTHTSSPTYPHRFAPYDNTAHRDIRDRPNCHQFNFLTGRFGKETNMSAPARIDQSLDSIIDSQKKAKRTTRRNKPNTRAAPIGGVKKTLKPARPAVKPATGPAARAPKNSKIVVSSLPLDVTENQIKVCQQCLS